ncbi:MAG: hypothetical protein AB1485_03675 [Candidatus Thermoplasmatota archaeon]
MREALFSFFRNSQESEIPALSKFAFGKFVEEREKPFRGKEKERGRGETDESWSTYFRW